MPSLILLGRSELIAVQCRLPALPSLSPLPSHLSRPLLPEKCPLLLQVTSLLQAIFENSVVAPGLGMNLICSVHGRQRHPDPSLGRYPPDNASDPQVPYIKTIPSFSLLSIPPSLSPYCGTLPWEPKTLGIRTQAALAL